MNRDSQVEKKQPVTTREYPESLPNTNEECTEVTATVYINIQYIEHIALHLIVIQDNM